MFAIYNNLLLKRLKDEGTVRRWEELNDIKIEERSTGLSCRRFRECFSTRRDGSKEGCEGWMEKKRGVEQQSHRKSLMKQKGSSGAQLVSTAITGLMGPFGRGPLSPPQAP
ncbi:hypothetical protein CEXT_62841 [Caerostris extrusa]|uniref:Uncharacterized protein n=1 Tax=Caerostris extrusa TaxID=172846 RepID=A0AAV4XQK0_CAEEX|nr:hypothetical protein CEXT_62841 [Caerostris extrusa]